MHHRIVRIDLGGPLGDDFGLGEAAFFDGLVVVVDQCGEFFADFEFGVAAIVDFFVYFGVVFFELDLRQMPLNVGLHFRDAGVDAAQKGLAVLRIEIGRRLGDPAARLLQHLQPLLRLLGLKTLGRRLGPRNIGRDLIGQYALPRRGRVEHAVAAGRPGAGIESICK